MKRLLHAILTFTRVVRLPKQVEWNNEDAAALAAFLRSTAGTKLLHVSLTRVVQFNEWATIQANPNACGQAVGFKSAHALLLSLAGAQSSNPEQSADTNGAAGPLDNLRP